MTEFIKKWRELSLMRRLLLIARIVISVMVVIIARLGLAGVYDISITNSIAIPSIGVVTLLSAIDEFRRSKIVAVILLTSAIFILGISVTILLG